MLTNSKGNHFSIMPSNTSKLMYDAAAMEVMMCNVKVAKEAWIEPLQRQRIDHTFEFQVQAISVDKLLCILNAVVNTTITATTNDHDDNGLRLDDNLSHHLNDLAKGVIERVTCELVASMTMAEMFRPTTSFGNRTVFGSVQLEIKHLGRLILYDAYIYVKPRFVEVSVSMFDSDKFVDVKPRQDATRTRQTDLNVEVEQLREAAAFLSQDGQEVEISAEDRGKQEEESTERPSKTDEIMACQSPTPLIPQGINSNDNTAGHLEQQKKSWSNYTLNTLLFACTMLFSVYMNPSSSTSFTIKTLFVIDIAVLIIINAVLLIKLPNWGNALVCISWFLLELAMCLLILPFNGCYGFSIITVLFLIIVVALLQPKFQHSVKEYLLPSLTTDVGNAAQGDIGKQEGDIGKQENEYLDHLLNISNSIATCGGLVTGIPEFYSSMEGSVTAAGFFFFCTVLLGLYLMMVIAMRAVYPPQAACLTIVLMLLLLLTIITASVSFVRHSSVTM